MVSLVSHAHFLRRVDVFKYNAILSVSNLPKYWSKRIVGDVLWRRNMQHLATLSLIPRTLEQYSEKYAEKWVKRVDENFFWYDLSSRLTRPLLNVPPHQLRRNLEYLLEKYYSGDVSGMIAESLFIYLLEKLGVNIYLVGHLRPFKRKAAFCPDFVIWDDGPAITRLISTGNYQLPIYAEVKGSTRELDEERLEKALLQLKYVIKTSQDRGLIFIAHKNPVYEGIVFEVAL